MRQNGHVIDSQSIAMRVVRTCNAPGVFFIHALTSMGNCRQLCLITHMTCSRTISHIQKPASSPTKMFVAMSMLARATLLTTPLCLGQKARGHAGYG